MRIRYVNTLGEAKRLPVVSTIVSQIRKLQIRYICQYIKKLNYDAIYLVGRYTETEDIILYQKWIKSHIIVGLHEVCNHSHPDFEHPSKTMRYLFDSATPIVVFSNNSYKNILQYKECKSEYIHLIPFGTFDSFRIYKEPSDLILPDTYYLFFGVISVYKGIAVLAKAINQIVDSKCRFVIAGAGQDSSLQSLYGDSRVTIVNRFLSNQEIAHLVRKAKAVVCPYLTMSQSGIPQTVFAFGTPVIASNLDGFKEVIIHGKNGLLFNTGDSKELAHIIETLETDSKLYDKIKRGASSFSQLFPNYDWRNIAQRYISLFSNNNHR